MIEFQFNRISIINLNKDLAVRVNALPILQSKEAALRAEAAKIRMRVEKLEEEIKERLESIKSIERICSEFPDIIKIKNIIYIDKKIASVSVKSIDKIEFDIQSFSFFGNPFWFLQGLDIIKNMIRLKAEKINQLQILKQVDYARRKTTQKVNLYEKVQIPFIEEAMRKIKRFLEDEENLSKSSQKILKKRIEAAVV